MHVGAAALLILLFTYISRPSREDGMLVEAIAVEGLPDAGGGGRPDGKQVSPNRSESRVERTGDERPAESPIPNVRIGAPPEVGDTVPDVGPLRESDRIFDQRPKEVDTPSAPATGPGARDAGQSKGRGGDGSGGGKGSGDGPGTGAGNAPGSQGSIRAKRNKRWTLSFSTVSGHDYLRQLSALGAILVAEYPDGSVMFRQLGQVPVAPEPVDSNIRQRMVWVDERPNFVAELTAAMGLSRAPGAIRAYFPVGMEQELLNLELQHRGKKEEEIHSTVFQVHLDGSRYRFTVLEQKYN
jgi:hypothetical protein